MSASPTSEKKGKAEKDKGKGGEAESAVETFSGTTKFVCQMHEPLYTTICEFGDEADADGICQRQGQNCGRGRKCYFAECVGEMEVSG